MIQLDESQFDAVASVIGDTPFSITPYFLLQRRACALYVNVLDQPRYGAIIPDTPQPVIYTFGAASLQEPEANELADFVAGLNTASGFMVPVNLVQPIRARRAIAFDVEGLCFSYRQPPDSFTVWRPEFVRQLTADDAPSVEALSNEAAFLFHNFGSVSSLLADGLAFGVFHDTQLVSIAASLAITPAYCDVGVYTRRRYRSLGYGTDCVQTIFVYTLARGIRPLWRIGVKQKVAIYFAEKLEMDEIGTDGQEVYLQASLT